MAANSAGGEDLNPITAAAFASVALDPATAQPGIAVRGSASDIGSRQSVLRIPIRLTTEAVAYIVILLLAIVSRFWDLGSRALHHDESLHAYYSWIFSDGGGYVHNPLMHGPFLFHIDALFFLLFGASDAVSRAPAALAGVILVGLPYLLRDPKFLGRWGALSTSALILVSPSILYYSRFIRHDIFTILGVLLLFICIVRYLDKPERRWLIGGAASIAALLTNHEIVFANLILFFGYLYAVLAIDRMIKWRYQRRQAVTVILAAHVMAILGGGLVFVLAPKAAKDELLDIPWQNPTRDQQLDYYKNLASNSFIIGVVIVILGSLALLILGLRMAREAGKDDGQPAGRLLGDAEPGSVASGVRSMWRDSTTLGIALLVGLAIFAGLFTTLFTNLHGLATSTFATDGTLLYWLGQHDVRRGEQPWFYYLVLFPQYEFIGFLFGFGASIAVAVRAVGAGLKLWEPGRQLFFRGMIVVWFLGTFAGISYAGEKMPWLIIHVALPACLLGGIVIGAFIERGIDFAKDHGIVWADWALFGLLLLFGGCWLALAGNLSGPVYENGATGVTQRVPSDWAVDHWWVLALFPLAALISLGVWAFWRGPQKATLALAAALVIGLVGAQVHAAMRFTYLEGDVPRDMLVYTQTSPDVPMLVSDLGALSEEMLGDKSLEIIYDGSVAWPLQWYLRDFTGKRYIPSGLTSAPDAPVLIISNERLASFEPYLSGYTGYDYVLRWWFPENEYRDFAIAPELPVGRSAWTSASEPHGPLDVFKSIWDSVSGYNTPMSQQDLFRLLEYRDLNTPNGQYGFKVFIRNDLLPTFNGIRY
jgi:predicted membrane-bound mannosyltransferase